MAVRPLQLSLGLYGLVIDEAGNVLVTDYYDDLMYTVAASTGVYYGQSMTSGHIYLIAGTNGSYGFVGDSGAATSAYLYQPTDLTLDRQGDIIFGDSHNQRIREMGEDPSSDSDRGRNGNRHRAHRQAQSWLHG